MTPPHSPHPAHALKPLFSLSKPCSLGPVSHPEPHLESRLLVDMTVFLGRMDSQQAYGLVRHAPRYAACLKAAVLLILPSRVLPPSSNIGLSERVVEDLSVFVYRWLRRYRSDRGPSDCTQSPTMTACLSANLARWRRPRKCDSRKPRGIDQRDIYRRH